MYVGVILGAGITEQFVFGIPHVRGGDPSLSSIPAVREQYSPCTWG